MSSRQLLGGCSAPGVTRISCQDARMRSHPRRCLKAAAAWVPHRGSRGRGLTPSRRQRTARAAEPQGKGDAQEVSGQDRASKEPSSSNKLGKGVNLFDPAATASRFLTRRFGFAGGLGFVALLASTELYEIVKALLESDSEGSGEVVETPSGLSYRDIKVGGGPRPRKGDFVGANFVVRVSGEVLMDTRKSGRPVAFTFGKLPYLSVNCEGVEEGMSTMRRGGVRELVVPPQLAYGDKGRELPSGAVVPPGASVTFIITLEEVTGSYL